MLDARNVTAIVVTYNRLPLLKQCLAALRAQTVQGFTVLLVDNASTDGTADYIKTLAMPGLVCRNPGENLGGAGGFAVVIRPGGLATALDLAIGALKNRQQFLVLLQRAAVGVGTAAARVGIVLSVGFFCRRLAVQPPFQPGGQMCPGRHLVPSRRVNPWANAATSSSPAVPSWQA